LEQPTGPLGQYLKTMVRGATHDIKDFQDEFQRDVFVKKVAHGINKDCSGLFPAERYLEQMRMQGNSEAISIVSAAGSFEAKCETFGIAISAAYADFCAACNRVPGRLGPFYFRFSGHLCPVKREYTVNNTALKSKNNQ